MYIYIYAVEKYMAVPYLGGGKMHSESLIRPLIISRPLAPDDTFIFLCDWFGYEAKHIIRLSLFLLLESPYVSAAACGCADSVIVSCTVARLAADQD